MSESSSNNKTMTTTECLCLATFDKTCTFKVTTFQRRAPTSRDVVIDMKYCGICHSDLHTAHGDLAGVAPMHYPCVPGHELAGICISIGSEVTRVKVGDHIGIGCIVDSCLECDACKRGEEQMCKKMVGTYNSTDKTGSGRSVNAPSGPSYTLGGYTNKFVIDERFAVIIPKNYPLELAGPVMCAGTTLFDPLRRYGAKVGTRVGVVGMGGLGQLGVKIAKAMGCVVTAITSSSSKIEFAKKLGADRVLVSTNKEEMKAAKGTLDLVLNTISVEHDYFEYSKLLEAGKGLHVILGLNSILGALMIFNSGPRLTKSVIGGIESSQAVIDLCAKHDILPEISIIGVDGVNAVYEDLSKGNATGLRYVIDLKTLNEADAEKKCLNVKSPALAPHVSGMTIMTILATAFDMWYNSKAK
jgi:alcohol dehydrogenase (NADP+)